ncbi:MAG: oxidoreductase [Christensenellales bacterium]|jgi:geranylgeranyl reductase
MFDIAIIGAGPAGSTLTRLLDNGMKALLLEKRPLDAGSYPYPESIRRKCCAGMLNSDAQRELASQGLSLPKAVLCDPQPFMVRALDLESGEERRYQRHYLNIHREQFDRFLFNLALTSGAAGNCDIRTGALVTGVRLVDGKYEIEFIHNGKLFKESARAIVAADGGASLIRRKLDKYEDRFRIGKTPYYAAIQEEIELDCTSWDSYGAYFASNITDYYSWAVPKEGHVLLGAALKPGKFATANFDRLKSLLIHKGLPFDGRVISRGGAILQRPTRLSHMQSGVDRAFFLGEAGGFISPSSSEGISWAIKTGAALARALNECSDIDEAAILYRHGTMPAKLKLLSKNARSFAMYNPTIRRFIFKTGLTSIR